MKHFQRLSIILFLFAITAFQGQAFAQVCFSAATDFPTANYPRSVNSADFNNDNILDLVTANESGSTISILLGDGAGNFGAPSNITVGAAQPRSVACADFNGDDNTDMAVAVYNSNDLWILLGDGTGAFSAPTNIVVGAGPTFVLAADFDNDTIMDLAVTKSGTNGVAILMGDGTGNFSTPTNFACGSYSYHACTEDFNEDGIIDLAVANEGTTTVSILIGDGTGSFAAAHNWAAGSAPYCVISRDFNGDNHTDLAIANGTTAGTITIRYGQGNGNFDAPIALPAGSKDYCVLSEDFNGDGIFDLANANYDSNIILVHLGKASGGFKAAQSFPVASVNRFVHSADFNGDGKPDMAATNYHNPGSVSVLLNEMPQVTQTILVCSGQSLTVGANTYNTSGTYIDVLTSSLGCDSTVTTELTVTPLPVVEANATTTTPCEGSPITLTGSGAATYYWTEGATNGVSFVPVSDKTYMVMGIDTNGCSATATISIQIQHPNNTSQSFDICLGDTVHVGSRAYSRTGVYQDILTSSYGCDSIVTTEVNAIFGNDSALFSPYNTLKTGKTPEDIAVNDFNQDGLMDIAVVNSQSNNFLLYLANAPESYDPAVIFATNAAPYHIISEDFNEDKIPDIAVSNVNSDNFCIYLGDGIGGFGPKTNFTTGSKPTTLRTADFDLDGHLDMAVINLWNNNISVLLGDGHGGFGARLNLATSGMTINLFCDDFNQDGKPDIIAIDTYDYNFYQYMGRGNGTFDPQISFPCSMDAIDMCVGDFDEDGYPDLATVEHSFTGQSLIYMNDGTGGFDTPVAYDLVDDWSMNSNPSTIVSQDFNGDGHPDLAVGDYRMEILINDGTGQFLAPNYYYAITDDIMSADVNGDGKYDIVTLDYTDSTMNIAYNITTIRSSQTITMCVGDTIQVGGNFYDTTGVYVDVLPTFMGCDSTVTTHVIVNEPVVFNQAVEICANNSLVVGINAYDTAGIYADTLVAYNGCDSIVNTTLTVIEISEVHNTFELCDGESVTVGFNSYNTTGIYTDILTSENGCDSIIETNLTIIELPQITLQPHTQDLNPGDSASLVIAYNGTEPISFQWQKNGVDIPGATDSILTFVHLAQSDDAAYNCVITNSCGSDVSSNAYLNINCVTLFGTQQLEMCYGDSVTIGNHTYLNEGTYTDTLTAVNYCDSILTTTLTYTYIPVQPNLGNDTLTCDGAVLSVNSCVNCQYLWSDSSTDITMNATSSGSYWVEISNSCGAVSDTVVVTISDVSPFVSASLDTSICFGDAANLSASGYGTIFWSTGDSLQAISVSPVATTDFIVYAVNSCGIDSATTQVTVIPPANAGSDSIATVCSNIEPVIALSDFLSADHQPGGTWLDNDLTGAIYGDNFVTAMVTPGNYYHFTYLVENTPCEDDSAMIAILIENCTGVEALLPYDEIKVFPNPASDKLIIISGQQYQLQIVSMTGQVVFSTQLQNQTNSVNISQLARGIYTLRFTSDNQSFIQKLVKE
ncbi:MAG: VCBS repeat-containing protein [Bacteroidetes bacterium]|nr:VCBS repeat-containing protein [Bacteroidota bacterium]